MKDNSGPSSTVKLFAVIFFTTFIGVMIGYLSGMQTPPEQLVADIRVEEIASINAILYGLGGCIFGIVGSIAFVLLRK